MGTGWPTVVLGPLRGEGSRGNTELINGSVNPKWYLCWSAPVPAAVSVTQGTDRTLTWDEGGTSRGRSCVVMTLQRMVSHKLGH